MRPRILHQPFLKLLQAVGCALGWGAKEGVAAPDTITARTARELARCSLGAGMVPRISHGMKLSPCTPYNNNLWVHFIFTDGYLGHFGEVKQLFIQRDWYFTGIFCIIKGIQYIWFPIALVAEDVLCVGSMPWFCRPRHGYNVVISQECSDSGSRILASSFLASDFTRVSWNASLLHIVYMMAKGGGHW